MSIYAENSKRRELAGMGIPARKKARVEIEWHRFIDGTSEHQPIIYVDKERIHLDPCPTAAQAYAAGELYLAKHGLLHDYTRVERDRCGNEVTGRG